MRLIVQTGNTGNFVCPWCAGKFETRALLDQHWLDNPECARNKNASNQTQTKYNSPGQAKTVPGENVLQRVRGGLCDHTSHQEITNSQGELIALQCLDCYTYFPVHDGSKDE